jgi:hypothetical protein
MVLLGATSITIDRSLRATAEWDKPKQRTAVSSLGLGLLRAALRRGDAGPRTVAEEVDLALSCERGVEQRVQVHRGLLSLGGGIRASAAVGDPPGRSCSCCSARHAS